MSTSRCSGSDVSYERILKKGIPGRTTTFITDLAAYINKEYDEEPVSMKLLEENFKGSGIVKFHFPFQWEAEGKQEVARDI